MITLSDLTPILDNLESGYLRAAKRSLLDLIDRETPKEYPPENRKTKSEKADA